MDKPTEEQIKEFWEWCGLEYRETEYTVSSPPVEDEPAYYLGWFSPDGKFLSLKPALPIDLNNLFKYAVPIVHNKLGDEDCYNLMIRWIRDVIFGANPVLVLFWAIWQALKEGV